MEARRRKASVLLLKHSQSRASRRQRPSHAPFDRLRMKGAFDDPAFRENDEALGLIRSLDDLDVDALENPGDGAP